MTTTDNDIIVVSGFAPAANATEAARAERDALLAMARSLPGAVRDKDDAERAGDMLRQIKAFTREIESSRAEVKGPVLELGKRIDALAKELTGDLESEAQRLSRVVGAWQVEQNRIAEEARRKAWEEEQRIKEEANRKIAEAQATAKSEAAFERKAERIEQKAVEAIIETRVAAAAVAAPKPNGLATREEVCFEVTDVVALHEAAPYLVNLTPNNAAIKAAVKALTPGQSLPGVRHWREAKTIVR